VTDQEREPLDANEDDSSEEETPQERTREPEHEGDGPTSQPGPPGPPGGPSK
jgi:hypothetical protein